MSTVIEIREHTPITKAREVDEDAGVLYDLAAIGPTSAWGHDYPEDTMKAALPLLEGRQCFANHTKNKGDEPSVYDVLGVWRNLYVKEGKTWGNFHYFKSHPLASRLVEAARRPELNNALGFSMNGRGQKADRNGRRVVESILSVNSIDCVAQPATLHGLYESRGHPVKISQLIESLADSRPGYSKALREMAEAGIMSPDAAMEPPAEAPSEPATDHKQALRDAAKAILDDDSLSTEEIVKKIKAVLKLIDGDTSGGGDGPAETTEARRQADANLREENSRLLAEKKIRKAAGAARVPLSETLVEALARPGMTDAQAQAVVAELGPGQGGSQRPRSAAPVPAPAGTGGNGGAASDVRESKLPEGPLDGKAVGRFINGR